MDRRKITYKLYPSAAQAERLSDLLRQHKDLWNAAMQERIDAYRKIGKSISYEDQCASLTQIRNELPDDWATANCSSQQITLRRLNKAFQSFFRRVQAGQTPGFPRFKSIKRMPGFGYKGHGDGWRFTPAVVTKTGKELWRHGTLRLQGVGIIKARGQARTSGGIIKSCELLHRYGEWHLSLTVECAPERQGGTAILAGDWGTEKLLSLMNADGAQRFIDNPRWFQAGKDKQVALARAISRKKRGSKSWRRACRDSARFKAKQARCRLNHHHQLAAELAREAGVFVTETLTIKNMTASAAGTLETPGTNVAQKTGLNREILDTAPALLLSLIAYKVKETGGLYLEAPTRKLKPSQRCPSCWRVQKKQLKDRVHRCACGCTLDRDLAAAQVMLRWALEGQLTGQELTQAA